MKRRTVLFLAASSLGAAAIVAACTFPEVTFAPDVVGGDAAGGSSNDSGDTGDAPAADASGDAAILEAATRDEASAPIPDGSCLATDCDCDKDLAPRAQCDAGASSGKAVDCDDLDPLRRPNAPLTGEVPPAGQVPAGDWDCDGKVEKAYPTNLKCTKTLTGACTGGQGFKSDPGCGELADYFRCQASGLTCAAVYIDSRKQLCK
jgi:hypothetical protein